MRREETVRRLLERGLSARALHVLLPEWRPLIDAVADRFPPARQTASHGHDAERGA